MPHSQKESQLRGLRARMRRHWYSVFGSTLLALEHRHRNPHRPHFEDANCQLQKIIIVGPNHTQKTQGPSPQPLGMTDLQLQELGLRASKISARAGATVVGFAFAAFLLALGPRGCEHVIPIYQRLTFLQDLWNAI